MMNKIASRLGLSRRKRYHSGNFNDLEEISDPRDLEDEQHRSIRDWVSENSRFAIFIIMFLSVTLVVIGYWLITFLPSIFTNIWVQRATVITIVAGTVHVMSTKSAMSRIRDIDWLILLTSDGIKFYPGRYMDSNESDEPLFVPVRGFTLLGHNTNTYQLQDLSRELVRMQSNLKRDPDDPVVIRLHPEFSIVADTDYGTIVGQLSSGLEPDEHGNYSNMYAEVPDLADDDAIDKLRVQIQELKSELQNTERKAELYKTQRNDLIEEAQKSREEFLDFVGDMQKAMTGASGRHDMMGGGMNEGYYDPEPPMETGEFEFPADEEDIDEEL